MKRWIVMGALVASGLLSVSPAWCADPSEQNFGERLAWARGTTHATKAEWDQIETLTHIGKQIDQVADGLDRAFERQGGFAGRRSPGNYIREVFNALPTRSIGTLSYNLSIEYHHWADGKASWNLNTVLQHMVTALGERADNEKVGAAAKSIVAEFKKEYAVEIGRTPATHAPGEHRAVAPAATNDGQYSGGRVRPGFLRFKASRFDRNQGQAAVSAEGGRASSPSTASGARSMLAAARQNAMTRVTAGFGRR